MNRADPSGESGCADAPTQGLTGTCFDASAYNQKKDASQTTVSQPDVDAKAKATASSLEEKNTERATTIIALRTEMQYERKNVGDAVGMPARGYRLCRRLEAGANHLGADSIEHPGQSIHQSRRELLSVSARAGLQHRSLGMGLRSGSHDTHRRTIYALVLAAQASQTTVIAEALERARFAQVRGPQLHPERHLKVGMLHELGPRSPTGIRNANVVRPSRESTVIRPRCAFAISAAMYSPNPSPSCRGATDAR